MILGASSLFLLVFFLFYVFCCAVSICAVVFVLLSEMQFTKVRGLAMSIAGFGPVDRNVPDRTVNPGCSRIHPAGTFFLFAVMCVPYIHRMELVSETTGKSLEEIERYLDPVGTVEERDPNNR
ncbi:MFS transporter [Bacteroides thetaiotaomicron]|uniref:MFS transporter n=1 Tax=Bacteroides thetaiotaomicron TaxID=818 RepID=UPI002165571E|nr:MFS transporter [Bacteroides thetaiotaomicron]MCS2453198.1 MFS transporter [Bacteroides thetaiotaomicron]